MQDEEIDKIVQDAANQHHPPYDDSAWDKMEQLLDQHLPVKKERDKKPFFFLLLFLLIGGTAFYALVYPGINRSGDDKKIAQEEKNKNGEEQRLASANNVATTTASTTNTTTAPVETTVEQNGSTVNGNDQLTQFNTGATNSSTGTNGQGLNKNRNVPATNNSADVNTGDNLFAKAQGITVSKHARTKMRITNAAPVSDEDNASAVNNKKKNKTTAVKKNDNEVEENNEGAALNEKTVVNTNREEQKVNTIASIDQEKKKTTKEEVKPADEKQNKKEEATTVAKKKEEKKKKGFANNLGVTVSAGTDLSYVSTGKLGKATFIYGAGLSYPIGKRVLVRTGFYVSRKIYSATPEEYNGVIYPYLSDVDGDCRVFEIPVSVSYNFGQKGKHNWFAGAGVSSYLMKKESYVYNYKVPGGATYTYGKTVNNENKHYFSVLNLSAGYQYNLNNKVSFMAEPFVKVPLKGIGDGKMKLNSAGILLTATIRPFAKKK